MAAVAGAAAVDAKAGAARETKVDAECESYVLPDAPPVSALDVSQAFSGLDAKEKRYAHYMSRAAWFGAEIVLTQTSPESPAIFAILNALFGAVTQDGSAPAGLDAWKAAAASAGANAREWQWFVQWSAAFYTNSGNYLSFGDTKFVPRVAPDGFTAILRAAPTAQALANRKTALPASEVLKMTQAVEAFVAQWVSAVYSLKPNERALSFPESGVSTYYSPNVTKADMDAAQRVMNAHGISAYNTRLFKTAGADGKPQLELRLASAVRGPERVVEGLRVTTGDHSGELARVVENLKLARPHTANAIQSAMLDAYIAHFNGGDIDLHKASQRAWIRDVGPAVETNIGFIESYRDPFGSRGEFEGFVAVVNKETSKKFAALVDGAPKLLPKLPWPVAFEKDEFKRPDFTALEVITFAGSGIPAGINIPNYDDIRQNEGFKNVSLANVLSAKPPSRPITFLTESDAAAFKELKGHAFEVQVGCHELLGHGSGKLFCEAKDGKLNFDKQKTLNPLTGKPFTSWYKAGETYDTQFGYFASTMEECRAELVGLLLSADKDVLKVFGYGDEKEAANITYVNWLNMVRAGLLGLEFYTPDKKKWGQAHMQARYGILTTLLAAGNGLVTITETKDAAGAPDLLIQLDRSKIHAVGIPAVNAFLLKIQVYKSSADVEAAKTMYHAATDVSDAMLRLRATVMARKQARPMFVQSHTQLNPRTGDVELQTFPATVEGVVLSFVTRYAPTNY